MRSPDLSRVMARSQDLYLILAASSYCYPPGPNGSVKWPLWSQGLGTAWLTPSGTSYAFTVVYVPTCLFTITPYSHGHTMYIQTPATGVVSYGKDPMDADSRGQHLCPEWLMEECLILCVYLVGPQCLDIWSITLDVSVKVVFWIRLTFKLVDFG